MDRLKTILVIMLGLLFAATPAGAAFPGDNGKLVTSAGSTPSALDVTAVAEDGMEVEVGGSSDDEVTPAVSPSGNRIAFARVFNQDNRDLFVMALDGSDERRLTQTPRVYEESPTWSPNGRRIAFVKGRTGFNYSADIFVMRLRDGVVTRITNDGMSRDPRWSPDGDRIVFRRDADNDRGWWDLYSMDPDGSELRRLTNSRAEEKQADWAPGGRRIVYVRGAEDRNVDDLWTMRRNGSDEQKIHSGPNDEAAAYPVWSPDGRWIGFIGEVIEPCCDRSGQEVFKVRPRVDAERIQVTRSGTYKSGLDWQAL